MQMGALLFRQGVHVLVRLTPPDRGADIIARATKIAEVLLLRLDGTMIVVRLMVTGLASVAQIATRSVFAVGFRV